MSAKFYPNGAGGSVGDRLDTCKPLQCSGNIWYVNKLIGTNGGAPAGQNRENPLATIAQAIVNAADDDIIICLQGHTETLTAVQAVNKRVTIIGEGTTGGKPGVSFLMNSGAATIFSAATQGIEFRNLYFPENVQVNASAKIAVTVDNVRIVGCYFEQGANDNNGTGVSLATCNQFRVESTTFISTGVIRTALPGSAIKAAVAAALANIEMVDVVVSAGTVGFSNYAAIDLTPATSLARLKVLGLSLLLGADMSVGSGWTGYVNCQLATGGSRCDLP